MIATLLAGVVLAVAAFAFAVGTPAATAGDRSGVPVDAH